MSIVHISEDLKQEFMIDFEGKATVTIRGAARLLNIASQTLDDACRASFKLSKLAQKLTEHDFTPASFSVTGIPDVAFALIVEYYAFDANQKPKQAKDLCRSFLAIGIRTWIQNQLGYQTQQQSQSPLLLGDIPKPPARHRKPVSMDSIIGEIVIILMNRGDSTDDIDDGIEPMLSLCLDASELKMIDVQRALLMVARNMEFFDLMMFPNDRTGFHCPDQDVPNSLLTEGMRKGAMQLVDQFGDNVAKFAASKRIADKKRRKSKKSDGK